MSRLTRDGTAEPVSRDQILRRERGQGNILPNPFRETKFSGANADREILILPVQLTTSRIGNLTLLILTLATCDDHTYIHTYMLPRVRRHRASSPQACVRIQSIIYFVSSYSSSSNGCCLFQASPWAQFLCASLVPHPPFGHLPYSTVKFSKLSEACSVRSVLFSARPRR